MILDPRIARAIEEEARARSVLPGRPDTVAADALLVRVHREWLAEPVAA